MTLRAVVFDYGMVLTGQPNQDAHDAMLRITGLPVEQFEPLYWADRHAYDEGKLSGLTFWQKFAHDSGLSLSREQIDELNAQDARMWTTQNPAMLAWHRQLKEAGILTGILSNMGDTVLASIERTFKWIHDFDVQVWSYQYDMAKPAPEIYRIVLRNLGVRAEETLFIDDKHVNTEAARSLGMKAIEFTTVERLRADLLAQGYGRELPLPEVTA